MTDTDSAERLYRLTVTERQRLTDLLAGLDAAEWATASLCAQWRVREVVAHINATATQSYDEFLDSVQQAGGDINLACDRRAQADAGRFTDDELLATQRVRIPSRWTPGPGNQQGALAHEVIHGLDITVPLGLPAPDPQVLAAAVAGGDPASYAFFGVDLGGICLQADDAELTVGAGEPVRLPASDIVLVVTGRRPVPQL